MIWRLHDMNYKFARGYSKGVREKWTRIRDEETYEDYRKEDFQTFLNVRDTLNGINALQSLAVRILSHADDKLMLGHVQSDWTGLGPILEEDIASSAMAQDDLSHALTLYEYLGNEYDLDPDVIAFERSAENYFCCDLVTRSDEFDWAGSVVKRWLTATYMQIVIKDLSKIDHESDLGARCDRILPEQDHQVIHLQRWIIRFQGGRRFPCEDASRIGPNRPTGGNGRRDAGDRDLFAGIRDEKP